MVGTDIATSIYEHMVAFNPMLRAGARVANTSHGRSIIFPKSVADGTAQIVGEGTALAEVDPTFSSVQLGAFKIGQLLEVSTEMTDDNQSGLIDFLTRNMGRAVGVATGAQYMTGTGSNAPRGLIVAVSNDLGTAVQIGSASVEVDNLIDLVYSVSEPYRAAGAAFFMNDSTAKAIRKKKNASDEYVWQPSQIAGQPDTLLGYPVYTAPAMAAIGSANLSVAFGYPGAFQIRQTPLRLERSRDFGFDRDVQAFRAAIRVDSDLLDSTSTTFAVLDTD